MAKIFSIVGEMDPRFSVSAIVAAGAVSTIATGVPTFGADASTASPWTGVVAVGTDGNGTTSQRFTGIAKSTSDDTVAAAGTVNVWLPLPGLQYAGGAKTAADIDTQAEINALFGKRVVFDLTSTDWTIDVSATDAVTNCVVLGGGIVAQKVFFTYKYTGTVLGQIA